MPPNASPFVTLGIAVLACCVLALIAFAVRKVAPDGARAARRFALGAALWLGYSGWLAQAGLLADFEATPPPFLLVLIPMLILPVALVRSRLGEALAHRTPLAWLVGFHAFRLPLELVMHEAAREGTMPPQMTFTGASFDIVSGASALIIAALLAQGHAPRWLIWSWNVLGSLLLVAIMTIAIISLPRFHAFGSEPARLNTWVAYFPFIWLPAALVTSALFGHLLLWRRLLGHESARSYTSATAAC
jgi:small-conductance mechanosensitive channel